MQLFKKIVRISGIILIFILVAGFLFVRNIARKALPDYNQDITIENLAGEVTVIRDSYAVPAIYAESEDDLYRAVGFVMAQDRLWQMDLLRRAATGRLSELFGVDLVNTDLLVRSLRISEKTAMVLDRTDQVIIDVLEAFADGVNQFIDRNLGNLPPEFSILGYQPERWKPEHSVNLTGYLAWKVGGEWSTEIILHQLWQKLDKEKFRELIPDLELHNSYVHPNLSLTKAELRSGIMKQWAKFRELGLDVFSGSNSWVVSGDKSTTGKPLFAHDMHLFFSAPGTWYQMHHVIAGELNVTGVVLPGQPLIIAGHNERIAWGNTSVMVDDTDFYLETINPGNPHQYKFMGEWKDMEVRTETIKTGKKESVEKEILFTHRGPVISDFNNLDDQTISMKWKSNEYSNELRSIYLLNRAGNWDEFRDALSTFTSVNQNISYADVEGNIGIQTAAGIPIRKDTVGVVVSGEDDTYDWHGIVPFEELPSTFNPPEGFVISANNRTVAGDYPWYIGRWFDPPYRYDRIREMLREKDRLSVADFRAMLGDKKSKLTERMLPGLLGELKKISQPTVNEITAMEKLKEWNQAYHPERPEPLIFEKFYVRFLENLLRKEMGKELYGEFISDKILVRNIIDQVWENRQSAWLQGGSSGGGQGNKQGNEQNSFTGIVHKSFRESIAWIEHNLGSNPAGWAWGDVHELEIAHPLGRVKLLDMIFGMSSGPYSPGGSFHTVCPYSYDYKNLFSIVHGASHRHIYSTADWDESLSVVPAGTSGIPASEYYCDQTQLFVNDSYRPDLFSEDEVENTARYRMKLVPGN